MTFLTRASLLVLVLLTARPIAGQELHDSGITLVGAAIAESGAAIQIYSSVQARERCDINEAVLAAEAERAFRRDGIDAQRVFLPDTGVVLNLVVLAIDAGAGFCAAALRVELLLISSAAAGLPPMLAAQGLTVMDWNRREYVPATRARVEEYVSVIANAVRRARDEWQGR